MKQILGFTIMIGILPLIVAGFAIRLLVDSVRFGYEAWGNNAADWFSRS